MIATESMMIHGKSFICTYSDGGYMIEREGIRYSEAIDPAEFGRAYTETEECIPCDGLTETEEKAASYDIITGVNE